MKIVNVILIFLGGWFFLSGGNIDDRILTFGQQYSLMLAVLMFFGILIFLKGIVFSPIILLFPFLFFYMTVVSLFFGGSVDAVIKVVAFSLVVIVAAFCADKLTLLDVLETLVISLFLLLIVNIMVSEFFPHIGLEVGKFQGDWKGIYDQKNALGRVSALLMVFSILLIFYSKDKEVQLYSFFALISAVIVALNAGSRTGLATGILVTLLTVAFGLVYYVLKSEYLYKKAFLVILGIEVVIASALIAVNTEVVDLFTGIDGISVYGKFLSLTGRLTIWDFSITHASGIHFWFGYGLDNFWTNENFFLIGPIQGMGDFFPEDSHNGYIDILIQGGVVGTLIYGLLFFYIVKAFFKSELCFKELVICFAFIALFLISNITESYTTKSTNVISFLFVYMTAFILAQEKSGVKISIFPLAYIRKCFKRGGN